MKKKHIFSNLLTQNRDFEVLANRRNPNTNADEVAVIVKIMLAVSVIITTIFGAKVYLDQFLGSFPPVITLIVVFTIIGLIEVGKVWTTKRFLRSILQGWIVSTWSALLFWLFIGAVCGGAFYISYGNSTKGMALVSLSKDNEKVPTPDYAQVHAIDDLIASENQNKQKALNQKVEGGLTSWAGQMAAKKCGETISKLSDQRAAAQAKADADHSAAMQRYTTLSEGKAFAISGLGSKLEIIQFILLIALALAENMLVSKNKEDEETKQKESPHYKNNNTTLPNQVRNGNSITNTNPNLNQSQSERPTIQPFRSHLQSETKSFDLDMNCDTVSQSVQAVSLTNTMKGSIDEDTFNLCFQNVRREVANLNNENGKPTSVCERIGKHLARMAELDTDQISESNFTRWTNYLQGQAIPVFERVGYKPDLTSWLDIPARL